MRDIREKWCVHTYWVQELFPLLNIASSKSVFKKKSKLGNFSSLFILYLHSFLVRFLRSGNSFYFSSKWSITSLLPLIRRNFLRMSWFKSSGCGSQVTRHATSQKVTVDHQPTHQTLESSAALPTTV